MPGVEDGVFKGPTGGPSIADFVEAVIRPEETNRDGQSKDPTVVFDAITAGGIGPCDVRRAALSHTDTALNGPAEQTAKTRIRDFFAEQEARAFGAAGAQLAPKPNRRN